MSEGVNNIDSRVEAVLIKKWHLVYGVLSFLVVFILPLGIFLIRLDKNQSLQAQSIQTINLNHESHMQTALEKIAIQEEEQTKLEAQLDADHDLILKLYQKIEDYGYLK